MPFNIRESQKILKERLKTVAGKSIGEVFGVMIDFYTNDRAKKVEPDGGDMLLIQWSVVNDQNVFYLDLVRQFIREGEDEPYQLHLEMTVPLSPELESIQSGNQWCHSPEKLNEFLEFLGKHDTYKQVKDQIPTIVNTCFDQC